MKELVIAFGLLLFIEGLLYALFPSKMKNKYLIKKKISLNRIKNKILKLSVRKIDYIQLLDINKLIRPYKKNKKYRIFIAYYLRTTRLIDNI